ncbi:MAG: hypothetical protein ACO1OC_05205 [Tuberibacillus sp.]
MKKLILLGIVAIIGWTSFYDLTKGTLNFLGTDHYTQASTDLTSTMPYRTLDVEPGDTVLSLYEKLNPGARADIQKVMSDFKTLNDGVDPNHIQIGETYRFPLYSSHK